MNGNDWNDIGNRIKTMVQDAVESQNYQELNRQVRTILEDAAGGLKNGMKEAGAGFREGLRTAGEDWQAAWKNAGEEAPNSGMDRNRYQKAIRPGYQAGNSVRTRGNSGVPQLYARDSRDQILGTVMAIAGFSLTGVFGLSTLCTLLVLLADPQLMLPGIVGSVILGAVTAGGLALGMWGAHARGRSMRFRRYVVQIGEKGYCTVKELAARYGYRERKVRRDLKQMIQRRMFLQGHMDEEETCIMVTDELYQQYLAAHTESLRQQDLLKQKKQEADQLPEECRKILAEGREYIQHIRQCNEDLPGVEISRKLYRLETITSRIFDEVEKNPELAGELRKLMSYYLPTTKKLVDAYRDLEREPVAGEHVTQMKRDIEETLDTINLAFENLLDGFFEEKAWDISSDISVLHTMFAQEGLTGGDFASAGEKEKTTGTAGTGR